MYEPSETTPDPSGDTEEVTCENCGRSLTPMKWETIDDVDDAGYDEALCFCDAECIADWRADR